jgi:diguanylate cyclase
MKYQLYEELRTRRIKTGESIFLEGDEGDFAYIIEEGEVEIWTMINGQRLVLNVLGVGSMFGELALVDRQPRSASAIAKSDTLLMLVTKEQVNRRIQEADPILRMLLLVVMRYFRSETNHFRGAKKNQETDAFCLDQEKQAELSARISDAVDLIRMERDIFNAIYQQQFQLYYQSIINLKTHQIEGFEALIRWQHPEKGLISPDQFIPVAEATSLIIPIGQWVIMEGIRALQKLSQISNQEFYISFNIASRQIEDPNFLDWLTDAITLANIKPQQIKLEILERTLFDNELTLSWVYNCRQRGFLVVLDDFGTGYSSLQYLNDCHLDTLKIDKSFVQKLDDQSNSKSICQAIINLSEALGISVVAEGIETDQHLQILKQMNCPFGQGYLFSKPVPLPEVISLLSNNNNYPTSPQT